MTKIFLKILSCGIMIAAFGCEQESKGVSKVTISSALEDNAEPSSCNYNEETIAYGTPVTRTMFEAEAVNYGGTCVSEEQTGICQGGEISWSGSYTYADCSVATFSLITAGTQTTCALDSLGAAFCWGLNTLGYVGDGSFDNRLEPTAVAGGHIFTYLEGGSFHNCGLTAEGIAYCWGENQFGQLGDGTTENRNQPVAVAGDHRFTALSPGYSHTCGLKSDGSAYCWGQNSFENLFTRTGFGALGDGTTEDKLVPSPVIGGHTFVAIQALLNSSCGLTQTGVAYCWGANYNGKLGTSLVANQDSINEPVLVEAGPLRFASISAFLDNVCGLDADGAAYCWGVNVLGELGIAREDLTMSAAPNPVIGGLEYASLDVGGRGACGVTEFGAAYCWGSAFEGRLGNGTFSQDLQSDLDRFAPTLIEGDHNFISITTNEFHTCALKDDGSAYCWGAGGQGRIGDGTSQDRSQATKVK